MMTDPGERLLGILGAILIGVTSVAIVATLVGQHAQTASVIGSAGQALSSVVGAAVAPVSGSDTSYVTGLPSNAEQFLLPGTNTGINPGGYITGLTGAVGSVNNLLTNLGVSAGSGGSDTTPQDYVSPSVNQDFSG